MTIHRKYLVTGLMMLIGWSSAAAQTPVLSAAAPSNVYRLAAKSTYTEGCFPPCDCPIRLADAFRGTFRLDRADGAPSFEHYRITEVNWQVALGDEDVRVTGSGSYQVGGLGPVPRQRLLLDLTIGDRPPERFDSGWVMGGNGGPSPRLDISINMNGLECYDISIRVVASAVPHRRIRPYVMTRESGHMEGCLPPCLCPIWMDGPVTGTFGLLRVGRFDGKNEFAVLNVDWSIQPFQPELSEVNAGTPVSGFGFYRVEVPTADALDARLGHQLFLDLNVDGDLDLFDSGWVDGAQWPTISIDIAKNGFYCLDEVFTVDARPRRH